MQKKKIVLRKDYKTFNKEVSMACNVVEKRKCIMNSTKWAEKFYVMIAKIFVIFMCFSSKNIIYKEKY